ncbi:hypothetical protein Micbo1qcDRAFT_229679 [Microdochium bolleyi]|uniref:Gastric mucin-like protein n=1 Tax=Microdochium bolleyi TaxID=196109 RepID=A0A136JIE2_9PEZI|nr:hypothetical protein Micbo1qcDRAFT_229679 [Microdochium bolleyi]
MSHHGSVVAFEGNHDLISTQLRLLPNSPKILIVPSIEYFLDEDTTAPAEDLQANILRIHSAAAKRAGIVGAFLGDSTREHKKLVFLNGGTAAATAKCIVAIRAHYINTTVEEAEFIYHELVRNGVAGLNHPRSGDEHSVTSYSFRGNETDHGCSGEDLEEPMDDPISRAMQAADALDRETESLQPSNELDLTVASRPRSMSLPGHQFPDDIASAAPFYVFVAHCKGKKRPASYNDIGTVITSKYTNQSTETDRNYVDRGVDAIEPHFLDLEAARGLELPTDAPFEIVIPMLEDLVIHFKSEVPDLVLSTIISGLQEGTYPVSLPPLLRENGEDRSSSRSSTSSHESMPPNSDAGYCGMSTSTVPTSVFPADSDDYDPYASHGDYLRQPDHVWGRGRTEIDKHDPPMHMSTSLASESKSTPQAQPPVMEKNFHAFQTTDCSNAVGIQNSLRSILNIYFPPQDGGVDHFKFSSLPEMGSLWKPVFRDGDIDGSQARNTSIDLILAIGAQKGVDRSFLGAVSGSIEKLGSKPNGITRSGRLDLRYLIANAMQTFTAQPLTNQTNDNPFTNSVLLATLIIPFLELYLAAHTDTRFLLLEYPPEHLTTVLALQRLIGIDLIKVAGIIDAEAGEPKPFPGFKPHSPLRSSHSTTQSISCMSVTSTNSVATTATLLAPGSRKCEAPSFSKANFLLTSSATESEIATLISTIWKLLVDISPFYIPDGTPRTLSARHISENRQVRRISSDLHPRAPTPLIESTVEYAPLTAATAMMGFAVADDEAESKSPRRSAGAPVSKLTALSQSDSMPSALDDQSATSPLRSSRASITETIKSSKTMQTMASQRKKIRSIMLGRSAENEPPVPSPPTTMNGSFFDLSDDDDDRFAAEERKYIPLFGRTPVVRKGNSRKALKWLGLSVEQ